MRSALKGKPTQPDSQFYLGCEGNGRDGGRGRNFLLLCVRYIPLLMLS